MREPSKGSFVGPTLGLMEDEMLAQKAVFSSIGRATAMAAIAALALGALAPSQAFAGAMPLAGGATVAAAAGGVTQIRARRGYYRGGGAAAAAFAGIVGTGLAIAAAQNRRAYYDEYYGGPAYYGGGPYYYGGGPGYYGYYGRSRPYIGDYPDPRW